MVVFLAACSGTLPEPRMGDGEHQGEEPHTVNTMPPHGKVEIAPPAPPAMHNAVWIDGEWEWSGRRWTWKEHGWQEAPKDQVYELPVTKRLPDGRLVHFGGHWKKEPDRSVNPVTPSP